MIKRQLLATLNKEIVGTLQEVQGLWTFQYSDTWLENPRNFALSPHLPLQTSSLVDGATLRHVQWYFDNLLPEEGQRVLLASDAKVNSADAFGLLSYYGSESAGSLTLLPDQNAEEIGALRPLSEIDLSARIHMMPKVPLTHAAIKRMSLAGAQHKLGVVLEAGHLFEPEGALPSTHILKPDHPDSDYPHSVANEWFIMQLARKLGLEVPNVYRRYVPEPVYLIDRFDRIKTGQHWQRVHVIDACQLLGLDRSFKYSEGNMESLALLANACRSPAVARTRLFSWLIFNICTGNSDAHLKNLSFIVSHEGIQLAPHYDLLSTACYDSKAFEKTAWPKQTTLAWPILNKQRFCELNRSILLEAGAVLHLSETTSRRLLDNIVSRILPAAESLYSEVEKENSILVEQRSELVSVLAGEFRCLRVILHAVIKEMVMRLT